ncbi:Hint domain-containing protein [Cellvibrio mixtus]|uniref:Hint domain-containing protein n=1 Tax=Cellvibrio mixtus TaxID=39650 RepID=UPI000586FCA8|nr:Hint domain-containing protein [Cellvibrio mixtus]
MKISTFVLSVLLALVTNFAVAQTDPGRLKDATLASRCAASTLTQAQCAQYRQIAYYGYTSPITGATVPGCITYNEYLYAGANSIAPICSQFPDAAGNYPLIAVCTCGCFAEGTEVSVFDKNTGASRIANIENIVKNPLAFSAAAATDNSTLSALVFESRDIKKVTFGPEEKPLVLITTESGKHIGLSTEHGVLLSNGTIVKAKTLNTGDLLVLENGTADPIVDIATGEKDKTVFNFLTNSTTENGHLIVAEGLVVGDLYWQNILESEIAEFRIRQ